MTHGIIAAAVAMLVASAASAAPYRPDDDATVLVTVPHAAASTAFRKAQNALAANPNDLNLALEFARVAIRDGRASADPRRYGQAQAALRMAVILTTSERPAPGPDQTYLAALSGQRRRFGIG